MNTLDVELERLRALRERSAVVDAGIEGHRADVLRYIRETGQIRVDGAMDPDANPAKDVEARCKKVEVQRLASQSELDKLNSEVGPLSEAIKRIESGIGGKIHTQRLEKQSQVREAYVAVARRLLETVNQLAELSAQAREILFAAQREFPAEQQYAGQEVVLPAAGLRQVWDAQWVNDGQGTRRDVVVGSIFDWNRALVSESDPVAHGKLDQEKFFRDRAAEYEYAQQLRLNPTRAMLDKAGYEARARGEQYFPVVHPLSKTGSWKLGR